VRAELHESVNTDFQRAKQQLGRLSAIAAVWLFHGGYEECQWPREYFFLSQTSLAVHPAGFLVA
jgi:hypothetical protein